MAAPRPVDEGQQGLLPTAHVKFTGMSASALDTPADLGDEQTFTVLARCVGTGQQLRKDGEVRAVRTMEVVDVAFGEIRKAEREQQLQLVEDDPGDEDDE